MQCSICLPLSQKYKICKSYINLTPSKWKCAVLWATLYFRLSLTILPMSVFLFWIVLYLTLCVKEKQHFSANWNSLVILWCLTVGFAKTRRRHPIPQSSPVVDFQPPRCPPITPSYCAGTLVCFSWSETLEQSSGRYYYGTITTSVSKKTENFPISAILPRHYTVVSDCPRHGVPSSYFLL